MIYSTGTTKGTTRVGCKSMEVQERDRKYMDGRREQEMEHIQLLINIYMCMCAN
jgi:hypothetical protein